MRRFSRHGCWLRVVCAGLVLAAGCTNQARQRPKTDEFFESLKADSANLPGDVLEGSKDTFLKTDNITILALAGAASVVMHNSDADQNLLENFEAHQATDGFPSEALKAIGSPGAHFALTGLWYALSANKSDELNKERAWTMMTALSVTGLTTVGLKAVRGNRTPNGDEWAWPSGHASSSFTVASVLDEFYGPKVGIPAYILASLVGYRMADEGDHWASDVVFGAALGWVVGHTIAARDEKLEISGFKVLPLAAYNPHSGSIMGIGLLKQF